MVTEKHREVLESRLASYKRLGKKITLFHSERCHSIGDCLRELSTLRLLKEHFVLVKGSCVMNVNINEIIERFESTIKANSNIIQLKVFTRGSTQSELRQLEDNPYLLLDKDNRILYYDNLPPGKFKITGSRS